MEKEKLKYEFLNVISKVKKLLSSNKFEIDISLSEYVLLHTIYEYDNLDENGHYTIDASVLAKALSMSMPALSKECKKLAKAGLIDKKSKLTNLKKKTLILTDEGLEKLKANEEYAMFVPNEIIANIGEEDTRTLVKLLNKVSNVIFSLRAKGDGNL